MINFNIKIPNSANFQIRDSKIPIYEVEIIRK